MKTLSIKNKEIERSWFVVDATGKTLGRLSSKVAQIIRGKHKPNYTPNLDMGDFVIILNASDVKVTGNKEEDKIYWRHTGYPGGQRRISFKEQMEKSPDRIIMSAVKGMLPHNKLGAKLLKHLKVYSGTEHPHKAQKPKKLEV